MTRTELAGRAGLTPAVLRQYEEGAVLVVNLRQLRAVAAALGVTAGTLIDAHPAGVLPQAAPGARQAGRSAFVLLPTRLPGGRPIATGWRLVEYVPRDVAQRWERPEATEPGRTVSRPVLGWVSELLDNRAGLLGSAAELTGQRSWYVGPLQTPTATGGRP